MATTYNQNMSKESESIDMFCCLQSRCQTHRARITDRLCTSLGSLFLVTKGPRRPDWRLRERLHLVIGDFQQVATHRFEDGTNLGVRCRLVEQDGG